MITVHKGTAYRWTDEGAKRDDKHALAQVRAYVFWTFRYLSNAYRHQRHYSTREEPIDGRECYYRCIGGRFLPAQSENARADGHEEEHVQAAYFICRDAWNDPPEEGSTVEYCGKIEGKS